MAKIPSGQKEPSISEIFKDELPAVREISKSLPFYKRPLIPVVIVAGIISGAVEIVKQNNAEKKFIAAIKKKYDIEEVKVRARGCSTDVKNIYRSQVSVMQVNGVDYVFTLTFDNTTREPTLTRGPYISDSMPYQPCPIDPADLLRETSSS